jgi:succinate dehydrogenase hydrophobic anchor subunit
MTTAETYVTAAYLVFLAVVLLYVVINSAKVARLEAQVAKLGEDEER